MNINGTRKSLDGMRFSEIGRVLQEASPNKDGIGLRVELTEEEEAVFESNFGMKIGYAICDTIADAVRKAGGVPKMQYTYVSRIFTTTAAG